MPSNKGIASLRYRVTLCSQKDTYEEGGVLRKRAGVMQTWACVETKKGSTFSIFGATVSDPDTVQTHKIIIRYRTDLDITNLAWIYEERRKSGPRWYKVLSVEEQEYRNDRYFVMSARLVEKGNLAAEPTEVRQGIAQWGRV